MTSRELYEYALIELNKLEAPSLLLEDYNYIINKAVQQYINLIYAKIEADQQSTDDLRVLKATTILVPQNMSEKHPDAEVRTLINGGLFGKSYFVDLPMDYLHMVSCIVEYTVQGNNFKCYDKDDKIYFAARRLTSDMYSQILNNAYLRPMYKRPYYFINNINPKTGFPVRTTTITGEQAGTYTPYPGLDPYQSSNKVITNPSMDEGILNYNKIDSNGNPGGTNYHKSTGAGDLAKYALSNLVDSENSAGDRLANPSTVRLELRFGNDDSVFKPTNLYIDYVKAPMYIRLTQDQINSTLDFSQILEFPDYVCFEIVNIFTRLVMENASDPRLQTNMPINNTIANPALQQQTQQK